MSDVRIVTMQQEVLHSLTKIGVGAQIEQFNQLMRQEADEELAQAYEDGFEIVDSVIGGNERVLLTTWTLRPQAAVSILDAIVGDDANRAVRTVRS